MSDIEEHAPFAPSGLARVVACPGSFALIRNARATGVALDESDTPQSMEGTAAHWVASEMLHDCVPAEGSLAPNGVAVTDEMLDGAEMYVSAITAACRYEGHIERHISCASIHPDCHGTPDFAYGPADGDLFIADYKFGHRYVDAFENIQLLAYALGKMPQYMPTVRVTLCIVQPRSYHRDGPVRTWELDGKTLWRWRDVLSEACEAALAPDAACTPGPQCYKCPARHVCDAAQRAELAAFDLSGTTAPLDMSASEKSLRLRQVQRALQVLGEIESGLSEDVMGMIRRGENVPGFSITSSAGREKWNADPAEVIALGTALGVDVSKPALITPNQARKAGMPDEVVLGYASRVAGAAKLTPTGDKLRRVFQPADK